jgi:hypothetical protein
MSKELESGVHSVEGLVGGIRVCVREVPFYTCLSCALGLFLSTLLQLGNSQFVLMFLPLLESGPGCISRRDKVQVVHVGRKEI